MTIINVRGTSGSGKSTIMRGVMRSAGYHQPHYEEGRKQPLFYTFMLPGRARPVALIGHYEGDCGGCDTISGLDRTFALIRRLHSEGFHVLFEGLLITAEVVRTAQLHQDGLPLVVFGLSLPLEECLASVEGRRRAKAERLGRPAPPPLDPKNTESKHRGNVAACNRLRQAGVEVRWRGREEAAGEILALLS